MIETRRPAILVIDDDHMLLKMISLILGQTGYSVATADNGEEGLRRAVEEIPDLIILDIMMPDMNGLEVCRRLKQTPETSLIPVILLTSDDFIDNKVAGFELGAHDYITKPFNAQEFVARVKGHVEASLSMQRHGEQEKLKALEAMLDQVAHELRNPLVAIGGFARRIRDRLTDDDQLSIYASNIYEEVQRLERILQEIIELKNIILGSITAFDPVVFINTVLTTFSSAMHEKNIRLETSLQANRTSIRGDRKNLALALGNIVTNAIEAMEKTGGTLSVNFEQDASQCRIAVTDTGHGIRPSESELAFRPFYTSKISGSGMGLYAVHHIIEMHNGTVAITGNPGRGTRVDITLPNDCRSCDAKKTVPPQPVGG